MAAILRRAIWTSWNYVASRAAQSYIAGPHLADALKVCETLHALSLRSTIGYWNPDGEPTTAVGTAYLTGIREIGKQPGDCYLSIKLPALDYSVPVLSEMIRAAREQNIRIHFDSLGPESVDRTWSIIAEIRSAYDHIGCTVPSRWARSEADAERAIDQNLIIRVVKGQWSDPDQSADSELSRSARYLRIIDRLAGRARHVAVASHDVPLAEEALRKLRAAGTSCELELLYGLPVREAKQMADRIGVPIRMYIPYGYGFLPYCLSKLRNEPMMIWWIVKDFLKGRSRREFDELKMQSATCKRQNEGF